MATQVLSAALLRGSDTTETETRPAGTIAAPLQPSLARRMFDAFTQAQMRRAQREIARVMAMKGLRFQPGYEPKN